MIVVMRRALLLVVLLTATWLPTYASAAEQASPSQPAPAGIAVDGEGNVYVSDYALDRLVKFGPDGSVLAQWGSSGNALGQFNAPFGVAQETPGNLFKPSTTTLRRLSNSPIIFTTSSCGPVSAASPAYCAAALTQECRFTASFLA